MKNKIINFNKSVIIFCTLSCIFLGCALTTEEIAKRNEYLERAQVYYRAKKYMNALQQIEKALELDSESKRALVSKGWTLFYLGKNDEAEKWFVKAYEIDNANMWSHQGLAAVYFKRGTLVGKKLDKAMFEASESESSESMEEIEQKINKQRKEARNWFDKSLFHYKEAITYSENGQDLYNMVASVHTMIALPYYSDAVRYIGYNSVEKQNKENHLVAFVKEGLPHYEKALDYLEKYVKFTNEELMPIDDFLDKKKQEREAIGLLEEDHSKIDRQIEFYKIQKERNRIRNRIAQSFAGDIDYKIAFVMKKAKDQESNQKDKALYDNLFRKHIVTAKNRIYDMVRDFPEMRSGSKNLANIAKLEGDYETAMKYLEEYIKKNPMIRPVDKIEAKEELEYMERKVESLPEEE